MSKIFKNGGQCPTCLKSGGIHTLPPPLPPINTLLNHRCWYIMTTGSGAAGATPLFRQRILNAAFNTVVELGVVGINVNLCVYIRGVEKGFSLGD